VQNLITDGVLRGTGERSGNPASNSSLARSPLKQRCRFDEFERWLHMYGVEFRLPSSIHQCGTAAVSLLKDFGLMFDVSTICVPRLRSARIIHLSDG